MVSRSDILETKEPMTIHLHRLRLC